ncbi:MAG: CAF17-like 4Fe-4S cluster assembly/insertion protein YgfZ [Terriglobales bacterium]
MAETPLHDRLLAAGAQMGDYCGAQTARTFGDANAEYRQLLEGCAVYDLGWRGKIVLTGSDRIRWANGMVTNNIRDLRDGYGNYNFLLNAQGRIQGDLYLYNMGDHLMVDTERWQVPKILELFDKYIIMDDVEVTDISDKLTRIAVQGPKSLQLLRSLGLTIADDVEPLKIAQMVWNGIGISMTRMASDIALTFEIWLAPENAGKFWDALVTAGAKPVGTEALEMFRVAAGVPKYGQDITDKYIPQETEQFHALHFAKGCYLGQEIVERVRSRGAVHRHYAGFSINGPAPVPGTEIQVGGKRAGEITSARTVPMNGHQQTLALGYIRKESGEPGTVVQVDGNEAQVFAPPYKEALQS